MKNPVRKSILKKIPGTTLGLLFVAVAAFAQPPFMEQIAKLTADDGAALDRFGKSVSISGDIAIVGKWAKEGLDFSAAYIFESDQGGPDNWGQVAKLTASAAVPDDAFGFSVSLSGNTAIVGAYTDDEVAAYSGAAYVFERDQGGPGSWGQVVKLIADDAAYSDWFGLSVSLSGDTAIVGSPLEEGVGSNCGAAYVFERDQGGPGNWGQVAKLTADDAAGAEWFGYSVSLSGDTAIIGAYRDDHAGSDSGSAYIFERDQGGPGNWGQVAKLIADDAAADHRFGYSVSVHGDAALVGAYGNDAAGSESGAAYVFERDQGGPGNWGQVAKLTADDAATDDQFGLSVSISGDLAIVGAPGNDGTGSSYAFERDQGGNWGQVAKFTSDDAASNDLFGYSVSLSGDTAIAGAFYDDDVGNGSGSAYIFRSPRPLLTIPTAIPAASSAPIEVPVELNTNALALASIAFSVDYDANCLSFDPTDNNADGIPDAIDIPLPATFSAFVFFDLGDTDGELDFTFFANDPTTTTFTDGTLATITFTAACWPGGPIESVITPVVFSSDPTPSFGGPDAQTVLGSHAHGSVEIFSGVRGDCNADGLVSAPDITAVQLESFDGDGTFWADTLDVVPFLGSPIGCDANADALVDAGDLSCGARLIFGLACGGALRSASSEGPHLSLPAELIPADQVVEVAITFEPRGAAINSMIFSLDYDEDRLTFADVPGAVRFVGASVSLESVRFDATDSDGELDVVLADFTTTRVLSEGLLVEIDLRLLEPGAATIEDGVTFAAEPPASFGDVQGRSVPGTAGIGRAPQVLFADGFESGDTLAWSGQYP